MSIEVIIFWVLFVLAAVSGLVATYARSIVVSAYALFFTLIAVAAAYWLMGADFLAVTQIVIYVGGILVLLLFGVLLTNRRLEQIVLQGRRSYAVATLLGALLLICVTTVLELVQWPIFPKPVGAATVKPLGYLLLTDYLLAFELSSLTLLAALLGAAYLVRGREKD
jgi:NADH:ubiquinone oxidoreductase subunit 6 (subunit J)